MSEEDLFEYLVNLHEILNINNHQKKLKNKKKIIKDELDLEIYQKIYYRNKKEKIQQYKKKWYREKNNEYVKCACGSIIKKFGLKPHMQSDKHIAYKYNNLRPKKI